MQSDLCVAHIRLCMTWNSGVLSLILRTSKYSLESVEEGEYLEKCWKEMLVRFSEVWKNVANCRSVFSEQLDDLETIELGFVQGDHDVLDNVVTDPDLELENGPNFEWVRL